MPTREMTLSEELLAHELQIASLRRRLPETMPGRAGYLGWLENLSLMVGMLRACAIVSGHLEQATGSRDKDADEAFFAALVAVRGGVMTTATAVEDANTDHRGTEA